MGISVVRVYAGEIIASVRGQTSIDKHMIEGGNYG
jgi:hypothetical protein